jgi:hypothetical protein
MALTSSHMRALCLWEVNWRGEKQPHECVAQDGGDLFDGLIEPGIVIAHERCPFGNHPRRSPLCGRNAVWWMGSARRVAAFVNYLRRPVSERPAWGWTTFAMLLTNSWFLPGDEEKTASGDGRGKFSGMRSRATY